MNVVLSRIPRKFADVHWKLIQGWINGYWDKREPPFFRIAPREPLGPILTENLGGISDDTITVVELEIDERETRRGDMALTIRPATDASRVAMQEWADRHIDTPVGEFDWLPSFEDDAA